MNLYKECENCTYSQIWADKSKAECLLFPAVEDIQDRQFYNCSKHELDYDKVNRRLSRFVKSIDEERRALKREIKRLGGNPRKLGAI